MMEETRTQFFSWGGEGKLFRFVGGEELSEITLAYETYGKLNAARDNAVLVFHAMTGSQHVAGVNPSVEGLVCEWNEECQVGWWNDFVGSGKAIDTDRYFVICANYLGGCYGSTGPASIDPLTGFPFGSSFPRIRVMDIVNSQVLLLDYLGIEKLRAVCGASIGGLLVLDFAVRFPGRTELVIPIASGAQVTTLQRVLNFEQIIAIEGDENFHRGDYYAGGQPKRGLALARMIAHKTFISLEMLEMRAKKEVMQPKDHFGAYQLNSSQESYMFYQGKKFVSRFDANSYLRIVEAWQRFDLCEASGEPDLAKAFFRCKGLPFLIFSISSDVCFYPDEQVFLQELLEGCGARVSLLKVESGKGHDSFLLEPELYSCALAAALAEPSKVGTEVFCCRQ